MAISGLTLALVEVGEVEAARTLGEDTLQRSRRAFGPDAPVTLYLTQAVNGSQLPRGDDVVWDRHSRPL